MFRTFHCFCDYGFVNFAPLRLCGRQGSSSSKPCNFREIVSRKGAKARSISSENQPRRNEEHEGFFWSFLRPLRFFVVDSHSFRASLIETCPTAQRRLRRRPSRCSSTERCLRGARAPRSSPRSWKAGRG